MSNTLSAQPPTPEQIKRYWLHYFPAISDQEPERLNGDSCWVVDCPLCGGAMDLGLNCTRDMWLCIGCKGGTWQAGDTAGFEYLMNGGTQAEAVARSWAIMTGAESEVAA